MSEEPVTIASVAVVFSHSPEHDPPGPGAVSDRLMALGAGTVRIGDHDTASNFRIDVIGEPQEAADLAAQLARQAADDLGLRSEVLSVALMRDDDRVERFHTR